MSPGLMYDQGRWFFSCSGMRRFEASERPDESRRNLVADVSLRLLAEWLTLLGESAFRKLDNSSLNSDELRGFTSITAGI